MYSHSSSLSNHCSLNVTLFILLAAAASKQAKLLRHSMKQSAGPHAAPLLTRINFDGRSPQLDGQILTKNVENDKMHVPKF